MPTLRQWRSAALLGLLLLVVGNGGVTVAERWVSSGATVALISITPLATALWSGAFGQWPRRREWLAIGLGAVGARRHADGPRPAREYCRDGTHSPRDYMLVTRHGALPPDRRAARTYGLRRRDGLCRRHLTRVERSARRALGSPGCPEILVGLGLSRRIRVADRVFRLPLCRRARLADPCGHLCLCQPARGAARLAGGSATNRSPPAFWWDCPSC